jgi:hypothetical protein
VAQLAPQRPNLGRFSLTPHSTTQEPERSQSRRARSRSRLVTQPRPSLVAVGRLMADLTSSLPSSSVVGNTLLDTVFLIQFTRGNTFPSISCRDNIFSSDQSMMRLLIDSRC